MTRQAVTVCSKWLEPCIEAVFWFNQIRFHQKRARIGAGDLTSVVGNGGFSACEVKLRAYKQACLCSVLFFLMVLFLTLTLNIDVLLSTIKDN